mgnify:CR=1 FL=1
MAYYLINDETTNEKFKFTNKKNIWKKRVEIEKLNHHWTVYMMDGDRVISNDRGLAYYPS